MSTVTMNLRCKIHKQAQKTVVYTNSKVWVYKERLSLASVYIRSYHKERKGMPSGDRWKRGRSPYVGRISEEKLRYYSKQSPDDCFFHFSGNTG